MTGNQISQEISPSQGEPETACNYVQIDGDVNLNAIDTANPDDGAAAGQPEAAKINNDIKKPENEDKSQQSFFDVGFNCNGGDNERNFEMWERNHMLSAIALSGVAFVQAYLVAGVFPYAGYMTIYFFSDENEDYEDATKSNFGFGTYSGVLTSAFMIGRFVSSLAWGEFADKYGRIKALLLSVSLSGVFSLFFGMSPTYSLAVVWRFCLGLSNTLIALAKTLVSDLAKDNRVLEEQTMGLVLGVWGYGFLLCPGISGLLAEPLQQYPELYDILTSTGNEDSSSGEQSAKLRRWFKGKVVNILEAYPFILPNLFAFLGCSILFILASRFIPETLPPEKREQLKFPRSLGDIWKIFEGKFSMKIPYRRDHLKGINENEVPTKTDGRKNHDKDTSLVLLEKGQLQGVEEMNGGQHDLETSTSSRFFVANEIWSIKATRDSLLVSWFFLFYSLMLDAAFPLFCMTFLGLPEYKIGEILAGAGLLFILGQYPFYALLVKLFGLYETMKISAFLSAPLCLSVPFSTLINSRGEGNNGGDVDGVLTTTTFAYLSVVYAMYKITVAAFYAANSVAINRTVDVSLRGSTNGLNIMVGSIFRAAGPIVAGILFSVCQSHGLGEFSIFGVTAVIGLIFFMCVRSFGERGFA